MRESWEEWPGLGNSRVTAMSPWSVMISRARDSSHSRRRSDSRRSWAWRRWPSPANWPILRSASESACNRSGVHSRAGERGTKALRGLRPHTPCGLQARYVAARAGDPGGGAHPKQVHKIPHPSGPTWSYLPVKPRSPPSAPDASENPVEPSMHGGRRALECGDLRAGSDFLRRCRFHDGGRFHPAQPFFQAGLAADFGGRAPGIA